MLLYANSFHELRQEQEMVLDELNCRKCIMPDLMVRDLHVFDLESGGAPIPHIYGTRLRVPVQQCHCSGMEV
jgi:hypothetical protein